ncbi:hypothetical protein ABZW30_08470 [Kitasatospora sp. NPDC004669]|uniref:hypothetical protein n=1 Tax=Kitasatospora sp. NPDC004669 TaxID=3154555 RepID=UPI0033A2F185
MRLGHPPTCTCPIYADPPIFARTNQQMAEALAEWPKRVKAQSTGAVTHAARSERTRCGFLILESDVERPGCATVTCWTCLKPEASPTAKVDGRRLGPRRKGSVQPEDLAAWATRRATAAVTAALTSCKSDAVARALRVLGNPDETQRAALLYLFSAD